MPHGAPLGSQEPWHKQVGHAEVYERHAGG